MSQIVPVVPEVLGEGNTKTPPKKQVSPCKNWCFTLFNISEMDLIQVVDDVRTIDSSKILIGGIEICPESGKLHRHGVLVFEVKKDLSVSSRIDRSIGRR